MRHTYFTVAKHGSAYRVHFSDGNIRGIMQPFFGREKEALDYARKLREEQPCIDIYDDLTLGETIGRVI